MTGDPFEILGIQPTFRLDENQLQRAWLRKSATLHPDRAEDPTTAAVQIAILNDAKRRLEDPESRARILLAAIKCDSPTDDKVLPENFLIDILEIRQTLDDAIDSNDAAEIHRLRDWAHLQRTEHIQRIADLFDQHHRTPDPSLLHDIQAQLNAWRYIERMLEQIEPHHNG